MFRERVSQQTVGIHLETNRLFFYSNEADFIQGLLHKRIEICQIFQFLYTSI